MSIIDDLDVFVEKQKKIFNRINPNRSEMGMVDYFNHVKVVSGLEVEKISTLWKENTNFYRFWDMVMLMRPA